MSRWPRASALGLLALLSIGGLRTAVAADAWLSSGQYQLRNDLELLVDAGVIRVPITHWPMPRATLEYALREAKEHLAKNAAVASALTRLRSRLETSGKNVRFSAEMRAGEPGRLRDFDAFARESAELAAGMEFDVGRFSASLAATVVSDPVDDQLVRLDGSHTTGRLGNWLLSAHAMERWWGPAHDGTLILSNNARPMPTLMVERAEPRPFESRWLKWLGPWRFSFGISQMEHERQDVDAPLFMAWRVVFMPFRDIELGFSRTAQFCGEQLVCDLDSFANMLAGNDNVGIDATPENEPGNQMAGFDIRWNSPIGNLPYVVYSQYIGEDESSYLPVKYLAQLGLEIWQPRPAGAHLKYFAEYAATTCSALSGNGPYYNCAYNQGRFSVEGYRYRGRVVGHSTDQDSESVAFGGIYTSESGSVLTATARAARINHDSVLDYRNRISGRPADLASLEVGWRGHWWEGQFAIDLGVEAFRPEGGDRDIEPYGFIGWRHDFEPR